MSFEICFLKKTRYNFSCGLLVILRIVFKDNMFKEPGSQQLALMSLIYYLCTLKSILERSNWKPVAEANSAKLVEEAATGVLEAVFPNSGEPIVHISSQLCVSVGNLKLAMVGVLHQRNQKMLQIKRFHPSSSSLHPT